MNANYPPGTVNLDPDGVDAYGSLGSPPDALRPNDAVRELPEKWAAICADNRRQGERVFGRYEGEFYVATANAYAACQHDLESALASQQTSSSVSDPKWSPTPPTQDGWYWMEDEGGVVIVQVFEGRVFEDGREWYGKRKAGEFLWYGPIEAPPLSSL
jgi:hypothetical protein